MSKKSVLYITSRFPYPPLGGDRLKSYNMLRILSKKYNINFVSIIDRDLTQEDIQFCQKHFYKFKIYKKSKFFYLINIIKSIIKFQSLQVNYYYFKDIQKYINSQVIECDFVLNTLIRTSKYALNINKPKFLDIVDSIYKNYTLSIKNVKSIFWKLIYIYEKKKIFNYEKKCIKSYDMTYFVNHNEAQFWSKFGHTSWIPNGVNRDIFTYTKRDDSFKNHIIFFGKMDYQPNIDAVVWFIDNVFHKLNNNIKFTIIGLNPSKKLNKYLNDKISITGYVKDPYNIINGSFLCIAPMQTGGGIQNKILETMALGKITIISSFAANSLKNAKHNKELLVANTPDEYVSIINDIYQNYDKYKYIEKNANKFIKDNFTWEIYANKLFSILP
ncbi:glycosyltransferase [Campylobacter sputorum subsp. bubulus]|uniref:Glycosyltransferase n=1 Tax=Campylobacter sputorum subsp. sputorum TaxID=32024 RepID=A0A381DJK8_9BACT|nr:glycosyltransferase [Campylobacter sputorum]ASM35808.1 glycosyltransferase, family 1 [Campylobacter sputorum aubsp. sputorum RM3237]KAB0581516.1 glycosyltransferase [Campylobacter sputorum subsp. sputorum]QEL05998.1 glycosyltransferase, family 1 [Campylobacter sputorum subsp. sputorum]SUX09099.1 glycosyltransferase [Campylobacter sputorum subsp. bubulus]SUX10790.1 glycosyltransferase [Campylobacter sputorum subsp. sputorum]